jgi:exodeoxyribonuclease-5
MKKSNLCGLIAQAIKFPLTEDQKNASLLIEHLLLGETIHKCLILKGYAGTGKTTLLGALVKSLPAVNFKNVLLAPTGRAAKVLGNAANKTASTIHKKIYKRSLKADGSVLFNLNKNLHTNTLFIVDEASMIGDYTLTKEGGISSRNLLEDLMEYVFSGKNCCLVLLGDTAQLPPVGADYSPALDKTYLENHFPFIQFNTIELTTVLRQKSDSLTLHNATCIRNLAEHEWPQLEHSEKSDFVHLIGSEMQEALESCYAKYGKDETIVVCRSNKRANLFNQQIRARILDLEQNLCAGDYLMVVKNNYFWVDENSEAGFLANGELIQVVKVRQFEFLYGFHFAKAMVKLVDYPAMPEKEMILNLDSITSEGPSLNREQQKQLFYEIEKDFLHVRSKRQRYEKILTSPYFSALQVKYAYAVTCHKSQGGQWSAVFIDHGYLPEGGNNKDFHRWLYTAITRASQKIYLVNFNPRLLSEKNE